MNNQIVEVDSASPYSVIQCTYGFVSFLSMSERLSYAQSAVPSRAFRRQSDRHVYYETAQLDLGPQSGLTHDDVHPPITGTRVVFDRRVSLLRARTLARGRVYARTSIAKFPGILQALTVLIR